ncbi:hypothetical protein [Pyxidicoccus caerfyrddinensis]|uniref:hypothetical protein n=1 Tax=Pyxidicoccus caerfyrddinensis TaxID=2709663 RepID=UPI0013DBF561|nr:hypothetical protein [Pyxidicoccus caerfyrddinensis]
MAAPNESATSLRWLLDDLRAPLTAAWIDVRDRMRAPSDQTVMLTVDWISDPWITRGIQPANVLPIPTAAPIYDPPDDVDQWPDFNIGATLAAASLPLRRTSHDAFTVMLASVSAGPHNAGTAVEEFMASQQRITAYGDAQMIFGDQVRAWILGCIGSFLRDLVFTPPTTDPELIAQTTTLRLGAPRQFTLPDPWVASNRFGDRHLELLLNLTLQGNGTLAPFDPLDVRVGQGIPWQQAWRWLSLDVPAELTQSAIRLAARLLRSPGLRLGFRRALTSDDEELRTLATGVVRRWALTLKAMAWAEHALDLSWEVVRPADIACFAFSATKPEWPRRLIAISHRSAEVKPQLRHMQVWKSSRCAIDATYIPSWETNTGMIWGLFAASPAVVRVRTPGYDASVWCRREAEMVQHLIDRADYFANRFAGDLEPAQLGSLDEWETIARGAPRDELASIQPEFPAMGLTVWSPRPAPPWELAVLRAAGALRALSAYVGNSMMVNRIVGELVQHGDFTLIPPPTNHPEGWRAYAIIFLEVAAAAKPSQANPFWLRLPQNYGEDDLARDREIAQLIPNLRSGTPRLGDVLVAVEFLRTVWPIMVDERRGRFLILNLQGLSHQRWLEDPEWSLHRGLSALRGLPVPLWFLQLAGQQLSDWELRGDPPILTEHVDAQFGWMIEAPPVEGEWRARYPDDSGLDMSPSLRRLHGTS